LHGPEVSTSIGLIQENQMTIPKFKKDMTPKEHVVAQEYAIAVKFKFNSAWSRSYTYKSKVPYKQHDIVLVPMKDFYNVGKVYSCKNAEDEEWLPDVEYKEIIQKLDI